MGVSALYNNKTVNKCYFYNSISVNLACSPYYNSLSGAIYSLRGLRYPLEKESMRESVCETALYKPYPSYTKCHTVDNAKQHIAGPTDALKGKSTLKLNPLISFVLRSSVCEYCAGNLRAVNSNVLV